MAPWCLNRELLLQIRIFLNDDIFGSKNHCLISQEWTKKFLLLFFNLNICSSNLLVIYSYAKSAHFWLKHNKSLLIIIAYFVRFVIWEITTNCCSQQHMFPSYCWNNFLIRLLHMAVMTHRWLQFTCLHTNYIRNITRVRL